jgi:hypothetical protein
MLSGRAPRHRAGAALAALGLVVVVIGALVAGSRIEIALSLLGVALLGAGIATGVRDRNGAHNVRDRGGP